MSFTRGNICRFRLMIALVDRKHPLSDIVCCCRNLIDSLFIIYIVMYHINAYYNIIMWTRFLSLYCLPISRDDSLQRIHLIHHRNTNNNLHSYERK